MTVDISYLKDNTTSNGAGLQIVDGDLLSIKNRECVAQNVHLSLILGFEQAFDNTSLGFQRDILFSVQVSLEIKKSYTRSYILNVENVKSMNILDVSTEDDTIKIEYRCEIDSNETIENIAELV